MKHKRMGQAASERGPRAVLWQPTPRVVTGVVACGVGLLLVFGPDVRRFFASHFQPRITFAQRPMRVGTDPAKTVIATPAAVFEGEVARTEVRLREASAVALAASLAGLAAFADGRPVRDVKALLRGMVARGLLPPGVTVAGESTTLETDHSTLHLRFRPQPFAVEVLSLGRERGDGPALLVRVPDEAHTSANAPTRYFSALTLSDVKIPAPFATPNAILALGWRADTFRPALPDGVNAGQLAEWAEAQSPKSQVASQMSDAKH